MSIKHGIEQYLIILEEQDRDMAVDVLISCVTRSSTTVPLSMQDKRILVFHDEEFKLRAPFQFYEMAENANIFHIISTYMH